MSQSAKQIEINEREQYFTPFIKFLRAKKLREENALCQQLNIRYFRYDDFLKLLKDNREKVKTFLTDFEWDDQEAEEIENYRLLKHLLEWKIILRFDRDEDDVPILPKFYEDGDQPEEQPKKKIRKYPKKLKPNGSLVPGKTQGQLDKCFYTFNIIIKDRKQIAYAVLAILGVATLALFSIWPLSVKKGLYLTSLYMLIFMIGLIVVRLVLFLFFYVFGFEIWIFPYFGDDTYSLLKQFQPTISASRCKDNGALEYSIRFLLIFLLAFTTVALYHSRQELIQESGIIFDNVYEWGVKKLENSDQIVSKGLPSYYEQFEKELSEKEAEDMQEIGVQDEQEIGVQDDQEQEIGVQD